MLVNNKETNKDKALNMDDTEQINSDEQKQNITDKDKISVIVPVYNVEKYLEKCVDSLIKQSYKNLEIILVDDYCKKEFYNMKDELALNNIKLIERNKYDRRKT